MDAQDWTLENEAGNPLDFYLVAWRVKDLEPNVYRYDPVKHVLLEVGAAPQEKAQRETLFLQTEFAEAPLIILIAGNLAAACARHGSWGHRQLLLRAGSAGQALWLASVSMGLVGTVFAGFIGSAAREMAGVDGYKKASLLAFSVGYPYLGTNSNE